MEEALFCAGDKLMVVEHYQSELSAVLSLGGEMASSWQPNSQVWVPYRLTQTYKHTLGHR